MGDKWSGLISPQSAGQLKTRPYFMSLCVWVRDLCATVVVLLLKASTLSG